MVPKKRAFRIYIKTSKQTVPAQMDLKQTNQSKKKKKKQDKGSRYSFG
jgi:hypothetical protein